MLASALIGFATSVLLAVIANRRFKELERLPMQWGLSGQVNWTAPRIPALAFIPLLYALLASVLISPRSVIPKSTPCNQSEWCLSW